jgi:uncharacterized membrane protein HdeD (DUF308 family)
VTALALVYVVAVWAIVTGALEIAAWICLRRHIRDEWWLGPSGVLSVAFGRLLVVAPTAGALAMTPWLGAYAIVFGVLLGALAVRLGRFRTEERAPMARAA